MSDNLGILEYVLESLTCKSNTIHAYTFNISYGGILLLSQFLYDNFYILLLFIDLVLPIPNILCLFYYRKILRDEMDLNI